MAHGRTGKKGTTIHTDISYQTVFYIVGRAFYLAVSHDRYLDTCDQVTCDQVTTLRYIIQLGHPLLLGVSTTIQLMFKFSILGVIFSFYLD